MNKEIVVHVTTLEQWKSVLDIWFGQGYEWRTGYPDYSRFIFMNGARYLHLNKYISYSLSAPEEFIEYSDFMKEQEKTMTKETYYVTKEQLDFIEDIKKTGPFVSDEIARRAERFRALVKYFDESKDKALLRYLGGDTSIEFKVKEQLYRLWCLDEYKKRVYMMFWMGVPSWTNDKNNAFTAPLEEIEKHKTVSWDIEKVE